MTAIQVVLLDLNGVPAMFIKLGPTPPKYKEGEAKWNEIARPRRDALSEFESKGLATMTLDVMLDLYLQGGDVEGSVNFLESYTRVDTNTGQTKVFRLVGAVPHPEKFWVMTSIEEGEIVERRYDGRRSRQNLTLNCLEYNSADVILQPPPPAQAAQAASAPVVGQGGSQRTYTVKSGDTLGAIAARELGSAGRWGEIANANSLRDPNRIFPGQVLRLP